MERPYFGTVTITHYTLAKARLAARAHSRECRARPDVEKNRRGTYTASTRARKWQIPTEIGKIATWAVAANGLLRRTAARHAACARSPGCTPRPDVGGARPAHARASTRVGNAAGGAGRLEGVDRAAQNHFLGVGRAARSSHSRMRVRSFELETSSWRKVITVRRQERCERPCQRPELQLTIARADGQLYSRDAPGWRELEQEMTIDPSIGA